MKYGVDLDLQKYSSLWKFPDHDLCILKCLFTRIAKILIFFLKCFPTCCCKIPASNTTFVFVYTIVLQFVKFLDRCILKSLFTRIAKILIFFFLNWFPTCCCKIPTKATFVFVYTIVLQFVKFLDHCILKCLFTRIAKILIFFLKCFPTCCCKIPATKTTFVFVYTIVLQFVKFLKAYICKHTLYNAAKEDLLKALVNQVKNGKGVEPNKIAHFNKNQELTKCKARGITQGRSADNNRLSVRAATTTTTVCRQHCERPYISAWESLPKWFIYILGQTKTMPSAQYWSRGHIYKPL